MRRVPGSAVYRDRPLRRTAQLLLGLVLYGCSSALLLRGGLGLDPWNVFAEGLAGTFGVSIGAAVVGSSVVVMLLWIPLRQRPGIGTLLNIAIVGPVLDSTVHVLPPLQGPAIQIASTVGSIALTALATALYVGAGWGPGPRDGLMTGLRALGVPVWAGRTSIEATVCLVGWLLGGTVGPATLAFAVAIGPLVAILLPRFDVVLRGR